MIKITVWSRFRSENYETKPSKSMIFNSTEVIHTDEESFENPLVFNPDRFFDAINENRHPFSFIPFRNILPSFQKYNDDSTTSFLRISK